MTSSQNVLSPSVNASCVPKLEFQRIPQHTYGARTARQWQNNRGKPCTGWQLPPWPLSYCSSASILEVQRLFSSGFQPCWSRVESPQGRGYPYKIPFRDTLLYVAISVALVAGIVVWAFHSAHTNTDIDINNRWIAFSFTALFVFGFAAKDFRHHQGRPVLWATFAALLAAHFAILSRVFPAHEQVPFLRAIPLSIAEMFAVYILLGVSGFPLKPHDDVAKPPSL
jgi:hypothetical protein